jgi:hypothetical protein
MALAYDNSAVGTNTSLTFTVGSGANRIIFCLLFWDTSEGSTPTATWNGTSLTLIVTANVGVTTSRVSAFYLINPASGSHALAIGGLSAVDDLFGISYTGARQTSQPDNHNTDSPTTGTTESTSLTTNLPNCWILSIVRTNSQVASGTGVVTTVRQTDAAVILDSNGPVGVPGSYTCSFSQGGSSTSWGVINISIAPMPFLSLTESLVLTDTVAKTKKQTRNMSESVILTDTVTKRSNKFHDPQTKSLVSWNDQNKSV